MADPILEKIAEGQYQLSGNLTFQTVPEVFRKGDSLFAKPGQLSVDLQGVARTDSAGLALLIDWLRRAKQSNSSLTLQNIPQQMLSMARVSGLDELVSQGN